MKTNESPLITPSDQKSVDGCVYGGHPLRAEFRTPPRVWWVLSLLHTKTRLPWLPRKGPKGV